jgi:hypothetical protein
MSVRCQSDWFSSDASADDCSTTKFEHWFTWVAVHRLPGLAARLAERERIVAQSTDRDERLSASAEIALLLATGRSPCPPGKRLEVGVQP